MAIQDLVGWKWYCFSKGKGMFWLEQGLLTVKCKIYKFIYLLKKIYNFFLEKEARKFELTFRDQYDKTTYQDTLCVNEKEGPLNK